MDRMMAAVRRYGRNQIMRPTYSQQNHYGSLTMRAKHSCVKVGDMRDSARRAQHYHDLALEFLALTKITTAIHIRESYRMMGQHYLARARAELARAKDKTSATKIEIASVSV